MQADKGIAQGLQGDYENYIVCFLKFVIKTRKIPCFEQGQVVSAEKVS